MRASLFDEMTLQQNHFQLLGLPLVYFIDEGLLAENFRALQRKFHPDRYANASPQEKRIALQYATRINEAYQCLKSPLMRAEYLLELAGFMQRASMQPDPDFLMQQMEWRDQLGLSADKSRLQYLLEQTAVEYRSLQQQFADAWADQNYSAARHIVDKMHFVSKFEQEIKGRLTGLM